MNANVSTSRLIALIVACAMFMAQLDGAVVALALPAMARSFGVGPVQLTVGITAYLLVQVIFLPTGSWIADRFGAKRVFAAAVAVFTLASIMCALCHSLAIFIAARVFQGCAAAFMAPVGRIVLLESTEKQNLISVMTISTVPMLVAPSLGPALGGFITTYWSWPWIFLINVPFGIAGVVLALRLIPDSAEERRRPFDTFGFLLFGASTALILYALQRLSDDYPQWELPAAELAAGLILGIFALRHARRHPHPIFSLAAVAIPSFSVAAIGGGSLVRLSVRSLPYLLPMMFQLAFGLSAMSAGVLMLALNGGDLALKAVTTRTLRRFGFRTVLLLTTALSSISMAVCALLTPATPFSVIFTILLLSGMCRSLLFTGLGTLVFADVPRSELGGASILWNIVQQGTSVLGVSLSAVLLSISAQLSGEPRNRLHCGG
jgi:EmrB/QacA subfamily drug resistance transporter